MKIRKKQIVLCCIALASLLLFGVLALVSRAIAGSLLSQQAAERWSDEKDTAQISIFAGTKAYFTDSTVEIIEDAVDSALKQAAMEQQKGGPRLWYDAYSTNAGQMQIKGKKRGYSDAEVTLIGGDFFTMHPLQLVNGVYIAKDDLMQDRIVIDEQLAWELFGSSNVSGMKATIDGREILVAGVVKLEQDSASRKAAGDAPRAFMPYSLYRSLQGGYGYDDVYASDTAGITCYEIVMPDLVRGYALKTVTDALGGEQPEMTILQNTGRFSLENRWKTATHLTDMVMIPNSMSYPYWENAARLNSFTLGMLLWAEIVLLVSPVLIGVLLLWKAYRRLERFLKERRIARKNQYRTTLDIQV